MSRKVVLMVEAEVEVDSQIVATIEDVNTSIREAFGPTLPVNANVRVAVDETAAAWVAAVEGVVVDV